MGREKIPFWALPERLSVAEGELRLLSAAEVLEAWREGGELAAGGVERALCSNACLLAHALEWGGKPVFDSGGAVLEAMGAENIARLADRWGEFNRACNPSPLDGKKVLEGAKKTLEHTPYARLQWRVLRSFGALPTEQRARAMTDRDYLWCALNLALDRQEELDRLCPDCRGRVEREDCPVCGAPRTDWGISGGFDLSRFEELKGENAGD